MRKINVLILLSIIGLISCGRYQKLLKSSDFDLKYSKAIEYYDDEDYYRAVTLFEELIPIYKGTIKGEEVSYYYTQCHYKQGDYILAGYHFNSFSKTYPNSQYREEADYLSAYCHYLNSPNPSLDQSYTRKAIDALQLFINKYPESERVGECNELIDKLRYKLEIKSFDNAKLYFDIGDYKAANVSLRNSLKEFPDTDYREDLLFLILKSHYSLAENSILSKQKERYEETISEYYSLIDEMPNSKYLAEAERIYENSLKAIEKK